MKLLKARGAVAPSYILRPPAMEEGESRVQGQPWLPTQTHLSEILSHKDLNKINREKDRQAGRQAEREKKNLTSFYREDGCLFPIPCPFLSKPVREN